MSKRSTRKLQLRKLRHEKQLAAKYQQARLLVKCPRRPKPCSMVDRHSELSLALDVIARRVGVPSLSFEDVKASLRTNAEPSAGDRDSEETSSSDSEDAIRCNDSPAPQSKSTGIPTRPRSSLTSKDVLEIFALRPKMSSGRMARGSMIECKTIAPRYGVTAKTVREIWRGITWTETTMPHWTEHEVRMHVNGAWRRQDTDRNSGPARSSKILQGMQDAGQKLQGDRHHLKSLAIPSALSSDLLSVSSTAAHVGKVEHTRARSTLTSKDVLEIFALRPKMSSGRMARGSMIECKTIAPRYGVTAKTVREIWRGITWTETTMPHWTEHEVRMHVNGASRRRCTDDDQTETASHSPVEGNKSPANCHGVPVQGLGQGFGQPSSAYPVSMGGQHHLNLLAIQSALALGMPASTACFSPVVGSMPLFTPMTLGGGLGTNDLAANLAGGPNFAGGLGTNNFAANLSAALQASQLYQHATSVAIASAGAGAARVIT